MTTLSTVKRHFLATSPFILFVTLIIALLYQNNDQVMLCKDLLTNGRWTSNPTKHTTKRHWHMYGTLLHQYDQHDIHKCIQNQTLHFAGDSTMRQIFWAIAEKLGDEDARAAKANAEKHQDLTFSRDGATLSFLWDPFVNRTDTLRKIGHPSGNMLGTLIGTGIWQARFHGVDYLQATESHLETVLKWLAIRKGNTNSFSPCYLDDCAPVIMVPPSNLNFDLLSPERAETLTEQSMDNIDHVIKQVSQRGQLEVAWSTQLMTADCPSALDATGLHVTSQTALSQADVLLNRLCNDRILSGQKAIAHACTQTINHHSKNWFVAGCLFFAGWTVLAKILGEAPLTGLSNIHAAVTLLGITSYCGLADRTTLIGKSDKVVSQSLFVVLSCFLLGLAFCSTRRIRKSCKTMLPSPGTQIDSKAKRAEFLSRSQTEEWKGWMQVVILLYHYFGMSKVLWVYQLVRVLVASYLFLTGYGHATYFQKNLDFSEQRLFAVMVRLNMLPIVLAYFMNNTYDFYYFPGLASFWFLITYFTFCSYTEGEKTLYSMMRILTSLAVLTVFLSNEPAINLLTQIMRSGYGPDINPKELLFRIKLDFYAPYFGMVTSVLVHRSAGSSKPFSYLRGGCLASMRQIMLVNIALVLLVSYLAIARSFSDKFSYNRWHSILSILPITAYTITRNASEGLRDTGVPVLRWIGTIALELFVLQYHVWLAADTKGILRLGVLDIPFLAKGKTVVGSWSYWFDTALATLIFVWLSDLCAQATNIVTKLFVNGKDQNSQAQQGRTILTRVLILFSILWLLNLAVQTGQAKFT